MKAFVGNSVVSTWSHRIKVLGPARPCTTVARKWSAFSALQEQLKQCMTTTRRTNASPRLKPDGPRLCWPC